MLGLKSINIYLIEILYLINLKFLGEYLRNFILSQEGGLEIYCLKKFFKI